MTKKKKTDSPFAALEKLRDELAAAEEEKKRPKGKSTTIALPTKHASKKLSPTAAKAAHDDDVESFHRMMSGVTPMDDARKRKPLTVDIGGASEAAESARQRVASGAHARAEADAVHEHLRQLVEGGERFEVSDDGRRVEGRRVEVRHDVLRQLRRGVLPVDAQLDLHGQNAGEARGALETFLRAARVRGEKTALVIHGKGERSPGGFGVLRGEIAAWLSQGPASEHVAAFTTALAEDGGEGALYVLLRR